PPGLASLAPASRLGSALWGLCGVLSRLLSVRLNSGALVGSAMSNPWDIPPFPKRGDFDSNLTYAGVGRVISHWEMLEYKLARLYSAFVGKPDTYYATQEYGIPNIFRLRF